CSVTVANRGCAEFGERTRISDSLAKLGMLDLRPIVASFELLGMKQVPSIANGNQQDPPPIGLFGKFALGMTEGEALDTVGAASEFLHRLLPGHQMKAVADPVLVARRLVAETLLVNPLEQPARRRSDRGAEEKRDVHMAIFARIDEAQPDMAEFES